MDVNTLKAIIITHIATTLFVSMWWAVATIISGAIPLAIIVTIISFIIVLAVLTTN